MNKKYFGTSAKKALVLYVSKVFILKIDQSMLNGVY